MFFIKYCQKCSRILEEDYRDDVCPYCGEGLPYGDEGEERAHKEADVSQTVGDTVKEAVAPAYTPWEESELKASPLGEAVAAKAALEPVKEAEPHPPVTPLSAPELKWDGGIVMDAPKEKPDEVSGIDSMLEKLNSQLKSPGPAPAVNARPAAPAAPSSYTGPVPPRSQAFTPPAGVPVPGSPVSAPAYPDLEEGISNFTKFFLFLLSLVFFPGGIVAALVYMNNSAPAKKSFGRNLLMISIIQAVLIVILCCCFVMFVYLYDEGYILNSLYRYL